MHKENKTNVDVFDNPLEDKDGNRINPIFTVMGIMEDDGQRFFVLQNKTKGAKKSILHLNVKEANAIVKKQKIKNTNTTQYQYDDDPANIDVAPKPNSKSVAAATKEMKRRGYTEEDIKNDADFETEEEFVESNYNDIIDQRQKQKKQQSRFDQQESSENKDTIINDETDPELSLIHI